MRYRQILGLVLWMVLAVPVLPIWAGAVTVAAAAGVLPVSAWAFIAVTAGVFEDVARVRLMGPSSIVLLATGAMVSMAGSRLGRLGPPIALGTAVLIEAGGDLIATGHVIGSHLAGAAGLFGVIYWILHWRQGDRAVYLKR